MDQLEYDTSMSDLAANKANQKSTRAEIATHSIEKAKISNLVDTHRERLVASKRRADEAIADRETKRQRLAELQEQLKAADELADTATRAHTDERVALATHQQALERIVPKQDRLNSEMERLMDENDQEKQAAKATLSHMEHTFEAWKSELHLKSGALLHPIPYDDVDRSFQNRGLVISRVKAFVSCISDPQFWVNRLLFVAERAAIDIQLHDMERVNVRLALVKELRELLRVFDKTDLFQRLVHTARQVEVLCALYRLFSEDVEAEKERLGRLARPPRGNHTLLAKGKVSSFWARMYCHHLALPQDSEVEAAEKWKYVEAGEHLSRLTSRFSLAAAYVLPLAEFLELADTREFSAVPSYAYEWLLNFLAKPETKKLREFATLLCAIADRYHGFTKPFDLIAFTKELNKFCKASGLSRPPQNQREDSVARGVFALMLEASLRVCGMQDNSVVTMHAFKGQKIRNFQPKGVFESIVGFNTKGNAVFVNCYAVRLAMHLLSDASRAANREIAVLPDFIPHKPADGSTIICLVRVDGRTGCWLATKLKTGAPSEGAAVRVTEIIIYSPLGEEAEAAQTTHLSDVAISEIGRFYKLAPRHALRSYTWPVARTKSNTDSGIHAICHGLSLMNCGVPWLGNMAFNDILEMRQLLLRVATRALVQNSKTQTAQ